MDNTLRIFKLQQISGYLSTTLTTVYLEASSNKKQEVDMIFKIPKKDMFCSQDLEIRKITKLNSMLRKPDHVINMTVSEFTSAFLKRH